MSESVQRKAKDYFYVEIAKDEKKLVSAASKGKTEMVIRLLSTNMLDINRIYYEEEDDDDEGADYDMSTPLLEAANNGHTEIVQVLLDRGAKPNISNEYGYNPLQMAACMGHKEVVRLLIGGGANPNTADEGKSTPLHGAAAEGHKDVVQMLLDVGADPNVESVDGETPLSSATDNEHKDVEQLLLEKGARPNKEYYERKLLVVIREGNVKEVKNHLSREVDVNCDHSSPLKVAVRLGHKGIVHLLLERGADPNLENDAEDWEDIPLKIALEADKKDLARILLDAGAEPDEEDKEVIAEWDADSDEDTNSNSKSDLGRGKRQSSIMEYFVRQ